MHSNIFFTVRFIFGTKGGNFGLALIAVAYAAPSNDEQDTEIEEFMKLNREQGVNDAKDFLNKLLEEDIALKQEDDSSEQADDEGKVVSEEASEQDNDEEDEANMQEAFLAELQKQ